MIIYSAPDRCPVCDSGMIQGPQGVTDRVYGVAGEWNFLRCTDPRCGTMSLAHDLTGEQLASFYAGYGTHSPPRLVSGGLKKLYREALKQIWHDCLDYPTAQRSLARLLGRVLRRIPYFRAEALSRVFWLPYRPDGTVIDVGFGNAQGLALLREAGWTARGSETDDVCVATARDLGFEIAQGNFADGLFPAESADAITSSHSIEHLPDPHAFLLEAYRVLRSGGHFVLRTPNAASKGAMDAGNAWRGLEVPRHLCLFTPASLANLTRRAGFVDIEVFGTPLGGFIAQQTAELRNGRRPSARQGRMTMLYHLLESGKALLDHKTCEEIVLVCRKPS